MEPGCSKVLLKFVHIAFWKQNNFLQFINVNQYTSNCTSTRRPINSKDLAATLTLAAKVEWKKHFAFMMKKNVHKWQKDALAVISVWIFTLWPCVINTKQPSPQCQDKLAPDLNMTWIALGLLQADKCFPGEWLSLAAWRFKASQHWYCLRSQMWNNIPLGAYTDPIIQQIQNRLYSLSKCFYVLQHYYCADIWQDYQNGGETSFSWEVR